MIKHAYIHVPFCTSICSYCDFCKIYYDKKYVDSYLKSLDKEINDTYKNDTLETIYIGGGTPSSLNTHELTKLFNIISKLKLSKDYEFTIEANIETLSKEKLDLFKKYNVNRLSIGVESINKNNLKFLNRELDKNKLIELINYSKEIGINNINVDLIYALPNESINILKKDLEFLVSLDINHISTYSLEINKNTIIYNKGIKNIDNDLDYKMYKYICNYLKSNNFIHYEISNFCKDKYYSRHNLSYWNNENYYGFGVGASSYIGNIRYQNTKSITKYINNDYNKKVEILDKDSIIEYEIILNLRKKEGINLTNFNNKFGISLSKLYDYKKLINLNLLELNKDNLFINEDNLYIQNSIILKFLESKKEEFNEN